MTTLKKTILEIPLAYATKEVVQYVEIKLKHDEYEHYPLTAEGIYLFEVDGADTDLIEKKFQEKRIPYNRYTEFYEHSPCLWVYRPEMGQMEHYYDANESKIPQISAIVLWELLHQPAKTTDKIIEELTNYLHKYSPFYKPLHTYNEK